MVVDERSRHELFTKLEGALGEEAATTLMEHLPPTGWGDVATRRDLDVLRSEMTALRADVRGQIGELRGEMGELRGEMGELRADFRGEITAAVTAQTRVVMFSMLGAIVAHGALVLTVVRI